MTLGELSASLPALKDLRKCEPAAAVYHSVKEAVRGEPRRQALVRSEPMKAWQAYKGS